MKKRERAIEVADLLAIAHLGEELVIFIDSEGGNSPTSLCVQANFDTLQFGPVQPLARCLELNSYELIQDIDAQISSRHRILQEMSPKAIAAMLKDFNQEYFHGHENIGLLDYNDPNWEPGA